LDAAGERWPAKLHQEACVPRSPRSSPQASARRSCSAAVPIGQLTRLGSPARRERQAAAPYPRVRWRSRSPHWSGRWPYAQACRAPRKTISTGCLPGEARQIAIGSFRLRLKAALTAHENPIRLRSAAGRNPQPLYQLDIEAWSEESRLATHHNQVAVIFARPAASPCASASRPPFSVSEAAPRRL